MIADKAFAGAIPAIYETCLVPLIFEPYAADLQERLLSRRVTRLLEVAAGTGVVTRALAAALAPDAAIVATDLNQDMLDQAARVGTARPVEWRQADAMALPFPDGDFDTVVCQFGVMFFPDRSRAFAEARRVLQPGGLFMFSVWDDLSQNEFAECVATTLAAIFPDDPPGFLARTPYGYHDRLVIARDLAQAGFPSPPRVVTVAARSRAASAHAAALAYCHGTPLRGEIESRGAGLPEVTRIVAEALARRFGAGAVEGRIQAHVVIVDA